VDLRAQTSPRAGHLKEMKTGDLAFFYHTGDEKQVVGIAEVIREAYKDPTDEKGVFVAVDVKAVKPFPKPVTLTAVKAEPKLKEMALVKYSRLSVQPVTPAEWEDDRADGRGEGVGGKFSVVPAPHNRCHPRAPHIRCHPPRKRGIH